MHNHVLSTSALALGLLAGSSHAFWRLSCGIVQTSRIDPIINPGTTSPHAHKIAGASNINQASTYDSLLQSKCSSCEIQDDKSAYWTPPLYYEHSNGSFEEVPNSGMAVYYEGRGDDRNLQPFPPGFRMVSGDKNARSYKKQPLIPLSDRPIADRVSFACLDGTPNPEQPGMVNTNCKDGLRAQIHFQSCWNGKDLYKSDNSHVEYMSGLDNGKCPSTHPVPLMHLFYEVLYGVNDIKKDNGGRFLFSNGDPTGYGYHGDFLNGWKANILTDAVNQCAFTASGAVEDCAPFKPSLDPNFAKSCPELPSLVNEPVHGMLAKLPGCITITPGPQDATDADYACAGGQSSVKESLQSLNSSLGSVTNLTGVTSTFVSKVSSIKAANTETPGSVTSASVQTTASSQADNQGDDNEDESLEQRSIPDEYGSYPYEFPPTVTSRRPEIPNGSPFPHHHHSKRSESHGAVPGDDSYSYNFEQPSTTTSHRPWIPHGSPAPHRRPDKRRVSLRKIKTSR